MIKFSSLNRRMKYVSTPEIPLPACWKFAEVVFSVDSVQGGQGPRKEGQVLGGGGGDRVGDRECKLKPVFNSADLGSLVSHSGKYLKQLRDRLDELK